MQILDAWLTPSEAGGSKGPLGEPSAALQEALLSRSLQHPYVVTTYEYAVCREVRPRQIAILTKHACEKLGGLILFAWAHKNSALG